MRFHSVLNMPITIELCDFVQKVVAVDTITQGFLDNFLLSFYTAKLYCSIVCVALNVLVVL